MARKPKGGLGWCNGCDANLIGFGEKCRISGQLNIKKGRKYKYKKYFSI